VGEVLRREVKGSWWGDDADPDAEINLTIQYADKNGGFWPIQRIMKRYRNGYEDNIWHYALMIAEKNID
jgi:hypothetical protein